ncbi:M28 family peptidase [bacterium]|nr:MAG: M28 family peptidase [bacterium]
MIYHDATMTPAFLLSFALASSAAELVPEVSRPWEVWEANSEQRQPVYLGRTPLELALGLPAKPPRLPAARRGALDAQARAAAEALGASELEAWPVLDERGRVSLGVLRGRADGGAPWRWVEGELQGEDAPVFPRKPMPDEVFTDFSDKKGLYAKPAYGDCVWAGADGAVAAAWRPLAERSADARAPRARTCYALPQPPVADGAFSTMSVHVRGSEVRWPAWLGWEPEPVAPVVKPSAPAFPWPADAAARLERDTRALSGAVTFADGRQVRLKRKNSAQPDHQLEVLVDWLEERYKALGVETRRDRFTWRGIPQSNLVAVLPGAARGERPVLLVDHIDTAFAEDEFKMSGRRVSVPGADDNALATALLLQAAEALKGVRLQNDVWLVHLTGEEFPADDLGARRLVKTLLAEKRRLGGVVVVDMIGFRNPGDPVFQVSAGDGQDSLNLAAEAVAAASPGLSAMLRTRFDPESYLYNTDALIFSHAGFPTVLVNEHLNYEHNLERAHYHETTDKADRVDFSYAARVGRTAVEAVARAAGLAREPRLPEGRLAVPLVRQATSYSCGAAAVMAVLQYWGVYDGGESGLYPELGTTEKDGTDPRSMAKVLAARGLESSWREGMTEADLEGHLARGETVILDIQAWTEDDPTPEDYSDNWEDGHYVVLVGLDDTNVYVMDPSVSAGYGYFPRAELKARWRDYEDRGGTVWRNAGLGIVAKGKAVPAGFPAPLQRVR